MAKTTKRADAAPAIDPLSNDEIIVTGQGLEETLPQELSRYGYQLDVVTDETIRDRSYVDAVQALEMEVPGLTMTTQGGAFSYANISLQGSRNSDVLWTIDGVRIGNRLYNGTSPADTLPSSMIGRIEVLKGGQGLFYGTQAVAGVINVVSKPFQDETGGELTVGMNTNAGYRGEGRLNLALGDHKFIVWASKDKSEGYEIYDRYQPSVTDKKRAYDVFSAGVKYGYEISPDLNLSLHYIRTKADLDFPSLAGNNINIRTQQIAIGRLDYTPSDTIALYLKSYYHQWDTDYLRPGRGIEYWGFKDFGANALVQLKPHRGLEYHLGYEFQNYRGRDESLLIDGKTEQVHAVFGQIRTSDDFSRRLRLAAGVRHNEARDSNSTVWSASGTYIFSDALQVEGSLGTSFLLPDAQQLYGIDECCAHGNPNLLPERSFAINLGVGGRLGEYQWSLAGWDRTIDNLIATDRTNPPQGFTGLFVNIDGEAKSRGFEALLRGPLFGDFDFQASYTYSEEYARDSDIQIAGRPRHSGKGGISWAPDAPWGANVSARYFGKTETTVSGFSMQEYGNYVVADISAHTYLDPGKRRWRLNARMENLFDANYATGISSALLEGSPTGERFMARRLGVPRTFYLNISYAFGARGQ
ncbi:MAG TPA: TonB-dependent receptor [Sphingobium sp.]|nr:TonB-dependent receptor [Sphingobium sp.]